MLYYSTNHQSPKVSLKDAILHSAAPDGGLYMPEALPRIPYAIFKYISEMSQVEIAYFVANSLFGNDIPAAEIKKIGEDALNFPIPLVEIEPNIYVLELFHGPTMTVKDISTRFLARMLAAFHPDISQSINVMVATTGHSGSALANGFHNVKGINVFAIFPKDMPPHHVAQLSVLGDNVHAVGISGTIDDCRNIVRSALADKKLNEDIRFTCANSVNIGRVLPLTIPFFLAYAQLLAKKTKPGNIVMSVPCGNCGLLLSGQYARDMGLPLNRLVAACNANGSFANYMRGDNSKKGTHKTIAFAMDSRHIANTPRFDELCKSDRNFFKDKIVPEVCYDEEVRQTIKDAYQRTGYLLDPHSAISYSCLKRNLRPGESGIFMATAHPGRVATLLSQIIGEKVELPSQLKRFVNVKGKVAVLAPTYPAWKKYIINTLSEAK